MRTSTNVMIAYDSKNKRLAVFETQATPEFWNEQWRKDELLKNIPAGKTYHFLKPITEKFVKKGDKILEGGCGTGQVVYALNTWGYEAHGVDFAADTINTVTHLFPSLRLSIQDVRRLEFPNASFDGYWSLGVIEHFWNGYDEIIKEAHRVLKPEGILFLAFPWFSPLRKFKARMGFYPLVDKNADEKSFYEFMLDHARVQTDLEHIGFECVETLTFDALKGFKDELGLLHAPLQKLYESRGILARAGRYFITILFAKVAGHMILLVC